MLTDEAVGADLLHREELRGDDLPDVAPVLAVRGEGDVRRAVEEDVGDDGAWPGREDVVVGAQDGLRGARGRHDDGRDGAKAEKHEAAAAVPRGQVPERDVGEGAHQVEVPDDGEPAGRRRELREQLLVRCCGLGRGRGACEQEEERAEHKQGQDDERLRRCRAQLLVETQTTLHYRLSHGCHCTAR